MYYIVLIIILITSSLLLLLLLFYIITCDIMICTLLGASDNSKFFKYYLKVLKYLCQYLVFTF